MLMTYKEQLRDRRWYIKKNEIMTRDNYRCRYCKKSRELNVHHVNYIRGRMAWEYDNEMLVTLCDECHDFAHTELAKIAGLIAKEVLLNGLDISTIGGEHGKQ